MSKKSKSNKTKPTKTDNPKNEGEPASVPGKGASKGGLPAMSGTAVSGVPRVISLLVLLAVVLLISVLFFRVMANFLVPLFLAAVLTVVFKPLHVLIMDFFPGRPKLTALIATSLISLLVLAPTAWLGWKAYVETSQVVSAALDKEVQKKLKTQIDEQVATWDKWYEEKFSSGKEDEEATNSGEEDEEATNKGKEEDEEATSNGFNFTKTIKSAAENGVKIGLVGVQALFTFAFGLGVMVFALYYFFADGPEMLETLMHLSPLDDDYERELLHQFATVSRAVVLATVITAVVQGLLAGVGYYALTFVPNPPAEAVAAEVVAGDVMPPIAEPISLEEAGPVETVQLPVFLLTVLTMILAIVPFVGAMAIWVPVTAWVFFTVPGGHWPAIAMAIFGFVVISSVDNIIKPYILSGQSNLHPLLALLSVLGGVQFLGPIGILVGPMLVAFMQALLGMLRKELDEMHAEAADVAV